MLPIPSDEILQDVIAILGKDGATPAEMETGVAQLVQDTMLARRLIDWLPEIFGLVLLPHVGKINLPTTFKTRDKRGHWVEFDFKKEPLFEPVLKQAMALYHSDNRNAFGRIAMRSSVVSVVNKALNAGESLDGATLPGLHMLGIPAEAYTPPTAWWRNLFR